MRQVEGGAPAERAPEGSNARSVAERVGALLAPYIGPFNAKVWVKTVAERDLSLAPAQLAVADLPRLLEGLRHSLNTLMGRDAAGQVIDRIRREVR